MKTVAQFEFAYEANIVKARLEAAGIMAATEGEVSAYPCFNSVNPIKVFVNDEDYEAALAVLAEEPEIPEEEK